MNKELENRLIELLKNQPEEWEYDGYTAKHKPSGVELWLANCPYADLDLYKPTRTRRMSWWKRGRVRRLVAKNKDIQILNLLK